LSTNCNKVDSSAEKLIKQERDRQCIREDKETPQNEVNNRVIGVRWSE